MQRPPSARARRRLDADADAVWAAGLVEVLRQANRWVNHARASGCWRTLPGAQAFAAVRSYVSTLRKHRQPILPGLRAAFDGNPWLPPATAT